jgi:hypothetical protein
MNNGSTRWCKAQEPRLSNDDTTEYLRSLDFSDDRITLLENRKWESKDSMCNAALLAINEPCVLMEIDSDEIWEPWQLDKIFRMFCCDPILQAMTFACRYHVGENLITQGEHCYGDMDYEWNRAWKFKPGMRFKSHEPPILDTEIRYFVDKGTTRYEGLVFDHYSYATYEQAAYKEKFYGYSGLLDGWRRLQEVKEFPVRLSDYFPQVKGDLPLVMKL